MDTEKLLRFYLEDHYAASSGGLALAKRIVGQNESNDYGRALSTLVSELEQERESLTAMLQRVGSEPPKFRTLAVRGAELAGRLKPNGTLVSYSPLSLVVELEGMIMGVTGKLMLWRSLLQIVDGDERFDRAEIERLARMAEAQRSRLEDLHDRAAREALAAGAAAVRSAG
jgi:hypothetical protein